MASINFGSISQLGDFYSFIDTELLVTSVFSATEIVLENGDFKLALSGTGFNSATATVTGFTIHSFDGSSGNILPVVYQTATYSTGLSLSGLWPALQDGYFNGLDYLLSQNDTITGSAGSDEIMGFGGADLISGGDGDDFIQGDSWSDIGLSGVVGGNDTLIGGAGNDYLDGGSGGDSMSGGAGDDYYLVEAPTDVVTELAGGGTRDTVQATSDGGLASYTLPANVENMSVQNNGHFDYLLQDYVSTVFTAQGNALANKITIGREYGSGSSEKMYGLAGNDRLSSGGGDDLLDGGSGNDTLIGGTGSDTYYVDSNLDKVIEDVVGSSADIDRVIYQVSVASSTASLGGVVSGLANSIVFSAVENLSLGATTGTVLLNGVGSATANTLSGNAAANKLYGLAGNDSLLGNAGNDALDGGAGNDTLNGGAGNDVINGGLGNDRLIGDATGGGTGSDTFLFNTVLNSTGNVDTIVDFNPVYDGFKLENTGAGLFSTLTATGVLNAAYLKTIVTGGATDANDYVVYNSTTGGLYYDANGSSNGLTDAIQFAIIGAGKVLTNADFVVF